MDSRGRLGFRSFDTIIATFFSLSFSGLTNSLISRLETTSFPSPRESSKRLYEFFEVLGSLNVFSYPLWELRLFAGVAVTDVEEDDGCPVFGVTNGSTCKNKSFM